MYKNMKTLCRHFDQEGRSLSPPCPQGHQCRFIHPNDPSWARKVSSYKGSRMDSTPRTYRSALVPQSTLFLRRKNEELSMDSRGRGGRYYSGGGGTKRDCIGYSEDAGPRRKDIEKDSPMPRAHRSTFGIGNSSRQISPQDLDNGKKLQKHPDASRTQETKLELKSDLLSQFTASNSRQTVSLFLDLARLSREVDDLSQIQRKEEENTQTYKKISATLESISASAATTIAPQLSRSIVARADCKKIMQEKEKIMQRIWTDAVEAFVRDVTREVDIGLQAALTTIKLEARQVGYLHGRSNKRQRDEDDIGHLEEREKVKKRTSSEKQKHEKASPGGLHEDEINDMKLKIEQQAQMLALLAQENHEVRWM